MTKKKLLEEGTVRSFMKLANLQPLSEKFISEKYVSEEKPTMEEEVQEEGTDLKEEEENATLAEVEVTEGDVTEEAKTKTAKPGKMTGVGKKVPGDHKMKPLPKSTKNTGVEKETKKLAFQAVAKPKGEFEVVSESLEEMDDMEGEGGGMGSPEAEMSPSDGAGESSEHQATVKDALKKMLDAMQQIASEYGVDMSVDDTEGGEGEEMGGEVDASPEAPPKPPAMEEQQNLEEMLDKLTKRVASRLMKESKKVKR